MPEEEDIEELIEKKIEEKLQQERDEETKETDSSSNSENRGGKKQLSRRSFLKALGLGAGATALASTGAASWSKIQPLTDGVSGINADRLDGKDSSEIGGGNFLSDKLANRPSAGDQGRLFFATDGQGVYYDTGSTWLLISKEVNSPPSSGISVSNSNPQTGETITLYDNSSDPDNNIDSWSWDFDDGNTTTGSGDKTHSYSSSGTYNPSLQVTDNYDLSDTDSTTVEVTALPTSAGEYLVLSVRNNSDVYDFELSTAYDVSSASRTSTLSHSTTSVRFNNDGSKFYEYNRGNSNIVQYSLSTNYDVSTASQDKTANSVSSEEQGIGWNADGSKFYQSVRNGPTIYQHSASTNFDIGSLSQDKSVDLSSNMEDPHDLVWSNDGSQLFICDVNGSGPINEYSASTPFDIGSISYVDTYSYSLGGAKGLAFKHDGTKMYICGEQNDEVEEFNLSTAFDPSSASSNATLSSPSNNPNGVALSYGAPYG